MVAGVVGEVVLAEVPGASTGVVTGVPVGSGAEVRAHDTRVKYVSRRANDS